jgi:TolB protein
LSTGERSSLTDQQDTDSYPLPSPDGRRVAFQSDRDGDFEIYVLNLDTRRLLRLTDNDVLDRLPAWSPDGEWIVYSSDTRGDGTHDLFRVRADGSESPELVYRDGNRNSHARYGPSGRELVFTSGSLRDARTWEIIKLDLQSGEVTPLTDNDVRDASPTFTPDGDQVLFTTEGEGGTAIALTSASGIGEPEIIYEGEGFEWGMNYGPQGDFILFNSELNGVSQVFVMRADGSEVQELELGGGFYPSWLPAEGEQG